MPQKTPILLAIDGLGNGGAERQLSLLAQSLPEPYAPVVCALSDGPYRRILEDRGIRVVIVPRRSRFDISPAPRLWRVAKEIRPPVVHSWSWMTTVAMSPYCKTFGIPLIDGTLRTGRRPSGRSLHTWLGLSLADRVVANSRAGLEAYDVGKARGQVIYNGFDESRLIGCDGSGLPPANGKTTVVMVARMCPEKDWNSFLKAARLLAGATQDSWRFVAVGNGPIRGILEQEASDLVASGVVSFLDGGTEVLPIVSAADIGVLLSNTDVAAEGCSNAIMEYMACGLPVVCTRAGGNPELVIDGVTGHLIQPFGIRELAARLDSLGERPSAAQQMGEAGARRIRDEFSVERMVDNYISCYLGMGGRRYICKRPRGG